MSPWLHEIKLTLPSLHPSVLALGAVAISMGVEFSKYLIAPCGSFTKIARSGDGRVLYSLHTDESFSLFPRRNFNLALKAFLHCLGDVLPAVALSLLYCTVLYCDVLYCCTVLYCTVLD